MRILLTILLLCISTSAFAKDEGNVHVGVYPKVGTFESHFVFQVTVGGVALNEITEPVLLESKEFTIGNNGKPFSQEVQQQIVNGKASAQITFGFDLSCAYPLPTGKYKTPSGYIYINGKQFRFPGREVEITAEKNSSKQKVIGTKSGGFQLVQNTSNVKPYIGQQIHYAVNIIAPTNLSKAVLEEFEPEHVWRERYQEKEKKLRQVKGVTIHTFSESWFPLKAGEITLPPRILNAIVQEMDRSTPRSRRSLLGSLMPLFTRVRPIKKQISSNSLTIDVQALPSPPKPIPGYIPVGTLRVRASIDTDSVKVGEPVTISVQVTGDANLRPLTLPAPKSEEGPVPDYLSFYEEDPIIEREIGEENVIFFKTFRVSVIPSKAEDFMLPSYTFNWFDPSLKKYKSKTTPSKRITVKENKATQNVPEIQIPVQATKEKVASSIQQPTFTPILLPRGLVFFVSLLSLLLSLCVAFYSHINRMTLDAYQAFLNAPLTKKIFLQRKISHFITKNPRDDEAFRSILQNILASYSNLEANQALKTHQELSSLIKRSVVDARLSDAIESQLQSYERASYNREEVEVHHKELKSSLHALLEDLSKGVS